MAKKEIALPNVGNLEEAEFVHYGWKITGTNSTDIKVIPIGQQTFRSKVKMMRRICALGNAGGGILFLGVN